MKKMLATMISAAMLLAPISSYAQYPDVPGGAWYEEYLAELAGKEAIKGYEDGTFRPDKEVTEAEFIKTIISLTVGEPEADGAEGEHWSQKYISAAADAKLFEDEAKIRHDEPITRAFMAELLSNATVNILEEDKIEDVTAASALSDWTDDEYIAQCYCKGIIGGYEDGEFKPDNKMTRAEMCAVLIRLVDESQRLENIELTPEPTVEPAEESAMVNIKYINKEDNSELHEEQRRAIKEKGVIEETPVDLRSEGYRLYSYVLDTGEEVILDELPLKIESDGEKDINLTYYYEALPEDNINPEFVSNGMGIHWLCKVYHYKQEQGGLERCYHDVEYRARLEGGTFAVRSENGTIQIPRGGMFGLDDCTVRMVIDCEIKRGSIGACMPGELNPDIDMPAFTIKPPVVNIKLPFETKADESGPYAGKSQGSVIELTASDTAEFVMTGDGITKTYEYELIIPEEQRIVDKTDENENKIIIPAGMLPSEEAIEIHCTGEAIEDTLWNYSFYSRFWIIN